MDLEVVGRHALLFDDDGAAKFVNSGDALVEWHSLQIDRYDVRHLLSAPPPSRRLNRSSDPIPSGDLSLEIQLDHERYLDLRTHSDQPDIEEDEKQSDTVGYRAVAFSYGNTDDSSEQKSTDDVMESSRFIPPFPIPEHLSQSLPPTEKVHQIIARTALFVSKHGGQSEIILRVKQGDNPTFGFLMPGHYLHAYFRFLVEHPELLHSHFDGKSQDEGKKVDSNNSNAITGSLSLLGSIYGSGEEEEGNDTAKTEKDGSQDNVGNVNHTSSDSLKKMESQANATKDEPVPKKPILSNKDKVLTVKKNSLIAASKSGSVKSKEEKSQSFSAAADKAKSSAMGGTSKIEPLIIEPPTELKRLIDKIVEFIRRNGKHFEATLIEQDRKHGRFSFLLPSNQYHSYYLKILQTAQESKVNSKSSYTSKDETFAACDMPIESDRKEKFKMVIGKSKKESQETESNGIQEESGITVDAAAAAAILQAATRGIKNSNMRIISSNSSSLPSRPDNAAEKSDQNESHDVSAVGEADSSEAHLTKEQKLKAERLKRAKMFVAMLKSGEVPFKTGTSRGSSLEPQESGGKEREGSLAPADVERPCTGDKPERNYFGEEHTERHSKRKYRSRSGVCEDEDEDEDGDGDMKERDDRRRSKKKTKSRSRCDEDDENGTAVETEHKRRRRRHRSHSSSAENEDEGESSEEDRDHKHHKRSRKKHHSRHSSRERSRKRHSSKKYSHEEDEDDDDEGRYHKHSRKKHHSRRSSHHSRDKHGHRNRHSSRERKSRRDRKHDSSSNDEHLDSSCSGKLKKEMHDERDDLEEGEISSRASGESRGVASGHITRETSTDVSFQQRAPSQPSDTTAEVPDDLRAKIRAMLMATRL